MCAEIYANGARRIVGFVAHAFADTRLAIMEKARNPTGIAGLPSA
jgi:hypothetical protein